MIFLLFHDFSSKTDSFWYISKDLSTNNHRFPNFLDFLPTLRGCNFGTTDPFRMSRHENNIYGLQFVHFWGLWFCCTTLRHSFRRWYLVIFPKWAFTTPGMLVQDDHGAGRGQDGPRPRRARSLIRSSYATLDSCVMLCCDSMDVPHYIATHHVSMRQTQGHTGSSQ